MTAIYCVETHFDGQHIFTFFVFWCDKEALIIRCRVVTCCSVKKNGANPPLQYVYMCIWIGIKSFYIVCGQFIGEPDQEPIFRV